MELNARIPDGPIDKKWEKHRFDLKLVNPANKRKYKVLVVGSGLAGGAAAASMGELGYNVLNFCFQDSPRRAHSIAAQGGINAAKNYQNDGDSVYRLFYDTIKGGDFRSREANVYRLAEVSANIIDQATSQGVPFASFFVPLSGILAIVGGLGVAVGFQTRIAALLLVVFLVPVTFKMHAFWTVHDAMAAMNQQIHFMKNLSMLGAALFFLGVGGGPMSVDARRHRRFPAAVGPGAR